MAISPSVSLLDRFLGDWPPRAWKDLTLLVAVSGGADSVALLRMLAAVRSSHSGTGRLIVAHYNHRWRGDESDHDARFVAQLANQLGWPCEQGAASFTKSHQSAKSAETNRCPPSEDVARTSRYAFFRDAAERRGARYVVTAHTADDQAETILHRILRGTGPRGLAGIPRVRPISDTISLIRPLLDYSRRELLAYLSEIGQPHCEDRSNDDLHYTRNRIRRELLPHLRQAYNPAVDDGLRRLGRLAAAAQEVIDHQAACLFAETVTLESDAIFIDKCLAQRASSHLIQETLQLAWRTMGWPQQAMGMTEWQRLGDMLLSNTATRVTLPGNVHVGWEGSLLKLARRS